MNPEFQLDQTLESTDLALWADRMRLGRWYISLCKNPHWFNGNQEWCSSHSDSLSKFSLVDDENVERLEGVVLIGLARFGWGLERAEDVYVGK